MKILFISTPDTSDDRREWSGTMHQSFVCLQQAGFDVTYLSAMRDYHESFGDKLLCTYWLKWMTWFRRNTRMIESFYGERLYKQTLRGFDYSPYDVIFVPTNISIVYALPRQTRAKVVHLVDATIDSLFGYYTEFSGLIWQNRLEGHLIGKAAFQRSDLIIASSDWCKLNAMQDYSIPEERIAVIEFGANIEAKDVPAVAKRLDGKKHLNIYLSGVNWERKGGDVAVECCEELLKQGISCTLHITGMIPPEKHRNKSFIHTYGFLNKNIQDQYQRIISIMGEMDIFVFPSRAECSSIALCEACGFGLPIFCYDTGGTGNYVINGKNGYMLPLNSTGKDFASYIIKGIQRNELCSLSQGAVSLYQERLNWGVWGKRVKEVIESLGTNENN